MILSVWAPRAKSVDIVLEHERCPMRRGSDDYWSIDIDASRCREGYRYSIDGGAPLPDPRSRWQPHGVHGPSQLLDPTQWPMPHRAAFRAPPLARAVIYELHVGTFTTEGTYAAAAGRLEHLVQLGITHVELMPLATFPGRRGWGYDGVQLYAPFPAYGNPEELAAFVDRAHALGLAVLLDVVYNHLGPEGNYMAAFGPYFSDRVRTAWGPAINFDGPYSEPVRRFVIDNALMWLRDYGFDGLRLDAVHALHDSQAIHILESLADAVQQLGHELQRELILIAESDLNDPRVIRSAAQGGYALQAHWADDLHHSVHGFLTGERNGYYGDYHGLADLATALREGYVYQGQLSSYRQRRHGRPPLGVGADQLVVCTQNHDQIGNRAFGDRLSTQLTLPQLKAAAALVLLSPFVPMLFQGEEWGARTPFLYFTDFQDLRLGQAVAEGRRGEFAAFRWHDAVPDPQQLETFVRSKLDWSELQQPTHRDLLDWYRGLLRVRAGRHAAGAAAAEVAYDEQALWLTLQYRGVLAVFNFATAAQAVTMPHGDWRLQLSSAGPSQVQQSRLFAGGSTSVFATAT
jgi:maltooligosyltrehalose trehalohydrolase